MCVLFSSFISSPHRLGLSGRTIFFPSVSHPSLLLFISQSLAHSTLPHPLPPSHPTPHSPAGCDVNALPISLSIKQTCATRSSGRPEALHANELKLQRRANSFKSPSRRRRRGRGGVRWGETVREGKRRRSHGGKRYEGKVDSIRDLWVELLSASPSLCHAQPNTSVPESAAELFAGIIKSETPNLSFMFASSSSSSSLLTARHFTSRQFSFSLPSTQLFTRESLLLHPLGCVLFLPPQLLEK